MSDIEDKVNMIADEVVELCLPYLKRAITGEREACAKAIEARLQLLEGEGALDPAKSTTYVMGYCDGLIYAAAAIRRRADV